MSIEEDLASIDEDAEMAKAAKQTRVLKIILFMLITGVVIAVVYVECCRVILRRWRQSSAKSVAEVEAIRPRMLFPEGDAIGRPPATAWAAAGVSAKKEDAEEGDWTASRQRKPRHEFTTEQSNQNVDKGACNVVDY